MINENNSLQNMVKVKTCLTKCSLPTTEYTRAYFLRIPVLEKINASVIPLLRSPKASGLI